MHALACICAPRLVGSGRWVSEWDECGMNEATGWLERWTHATHVVIACNNRRLYLSAGVRGVRLRCEGQESVHGALLLLYYCNRALRLYS